MVFVKTLPEAIAAAAAQLEGIGNSFSAENAAAAAPTTALAPAASDEVSMLQAGVFSTYGQLYQTVTAQAQAIHQQFVNLLGTSAGSYGETEAANQVAAASTPLSGLGSLLGGSSSAASAASTSPVDGLTNLINGMTNFLSGSPLNSNLMNLGNIQVGNWASAGSDLIGMGGGGLLSALPEEAAGELGGLGALSASLDGAVAPATAGAAGGLGGTPVLAGLGQASSIGSLSVPPSWAGVPTASTPVTLAAQSWTTAVPHAGAVTTMPAGMPSVASAGRGGLGFGAPRYGVKPKVMPVLPKPTVT
jgi:hypothetical protein